MNEKPAKLSGQSLCLACGLCCDGTIFSKVTLKPDDKVPPLSRAGIHVCSKKDEPGIFKQPCAAHKNCACSVYAERPHLCRSYQCALLKRFNRSDISQDEALRIIRIAISARDEVNKQMLAISGDKKESLEELTALLTSWLKDFKLRTAEKSHAQLFLNFVALQMYIDKFFQKKPSLRFGSNPLTK